MNPLYLLFLLLPLAFLSGWWAARKRAVQHSGARVNELSSSYFKGLNYLLNEQPDKAIEIFLRLAESNRDAVETHLALGNLFRRRGEMERAIRVHQNLISRPKLNDELKTVALLELGEDYMRAGLLDRAETLFADLVAMKAQAPSALQHLISICQHERDWHKAIAYSRQLEGLIAESQGLQIAHFFCELAERSHAHGALDEAHEYLQQALQAHPDFIRALMLEAGFHVQHGDMDQAVLTYEHAIEADIEYIPEILPPLLDCYARTQQMDRAEHTLLRSLEQYSGITPAIALARLYVSRDGEKQAIRFLTAQLREKPSVRGLRELIETTLRSSRGDARDNLMLLSDLTRALLEGRAMYRCQHCGFGARAHHWQCPSCKRWSTVRPVHGIGSE